VRRCTAASLEGSRPSRAIANTTREVTTSTALAVAAVVSNAQQTISRRAAAPPNALAASASGAVEREAGTRLVERGARGVALTEPGRVLAAEAEQILGRLAAAELELALIYQFDLEPPVATGPPSGCCRAPAAWPASSPPSPSGPTTASPSRAWSPPAWAWR
jgi:hypothetical protein